MDGKTAYGHLNNLTNFTSGTADGFDGFMFEEGLSWALWIKIIATPIIVIVGIVGNILSFVVMSSRRLRHKSYSYYLRALAVFDSLTLIGREILSVEELYLSQGKPSLYHNFGNAACKVMKFSEYFCCLMSSWLVVFMAVERFIAIYFPLRKGIFCTRCRALVAILTLFIIVFYSQLYVLIMVEHVNGTCGARSDFRMVFLRLHVYFYLLVLILLLPVTLILMCNSMVLCKIYRYKKINSNQTDDPGTTSERSTWISQRRHRTTYMLLTITFTYTVTLLPVALCSVILQVLFEVKPQMEAFTILMAFAPYHHLLEVFSAVNYGINFFVYIISGKMFRREFRHVLTGHSSANTSGMKTRSTHFKEEIPMHWIRRSLVE